MTKWDERFIALAEMVASWSKDTSTRVGAVVTNHKQLVSVGYNGAPPGLDDEFALRDRETKLSCTIHAEHNAIEFAGKEYLDGHTLYLTHPPCDRCSALIIKKRVHKVIFKDVPSEWRERWNVDFSEEMLQRGGVIVQKIPLKSDE